MTRDYHGPCLILLGPEVKTVEVRRCGRVETVSMPIVSEEDDGQYEDVPECRSDAAVQVGG